MMLYLSEMVITAGLVLDIIGAVMLASVLFITKEKAADQSGGKWGYDKNDPRRYETPEVKDLLRHSRRGKWGVAILALGFSMQIVGQWL